MHSLNVDKTDAEAWALRCIEHALAGHAVEDEFVELKSSPNEPKRAARRVAAHANVAAAAGAKVILWLIGVDENQKRVVSADWTAFGDFGRWWQQVASCFEGSGPQLSFSLNLHVENQVVTALLIDVSEPPFSVVVGGAVEREFPWRSGTRTRSATSAELGQLLKRSESIPSIDVLNCSAMFRTDEIIVGRSTSRWDVFASRSSRPSREVFELGRYLFSEWKVLVIPRGKAVTVVREFTRVTIRSLQSRPIVLNSVTFVSNKEETQHVPVPQIVELRAEERFAHDPLASIRSESLSVTLELGLAGQSSTLTTVILVWSSAREAFVYQRSSPPQSDSS
jgi:hypothetical protein